MTIHKRLVPSMVENAVDKRLEALIDVIHFHAWTGLWVIYFAGLALFALHEAHDAHTATSK
jgi:hypothetical protein